MHLLSLMTLHDLIVDYKAFYIHEVNCPQSSIQLRFMKHEPDVDTNLAQPA